MFGAFFLFCWQELQAFKKAEGRRFDPRPSHFGVHSWKGSEASSLYLIPLSGAPLCQETAPPCLSLSCPPSPVLRTPGPPPSPPADFLLQRGFSDPPTVSVSLWEVDRRGGWD